MLMPKIVKTLLALLLIPLCFVVGLYGGPYASSLYQTIFPEPEYNTGNFREMYQRSGTEIVMYSSSTCPYCAKARELFTARGVSFTEYQIDTSKTAAVEFERLGGEYVPVIFIGERRIGGFREQAIRDALAEIGKKS
jgi:glutaredoxin/uncharacterized protein YneF (UPF0154 family)